MLMKFLNDTEIRVSCKIRNILLALFLCFIWTSFVGSFLNEIRTIDYESEPKEGALYLFVMACIWAPIWEELAYRYGPIEVVRKINPDIMLPVIVMVSCSFGWGHGGPENVAIQGFIGLVASCLYIKNGYSLWSSILFHASWNTLIIFVLPLIQKIFGGITY